MGAQTLKDGLWQSKYLIQQICISCLLSEVILQVMGYGDEQTD